LHYFKREDCPSKPCGSADYGEERAGCRPSPHANTVLKTLFPNPILNTPQKGTISALFSARPLS